MQNGRSVVIDSARAHGLFPSQIDPLLLAYFMVGAEGDDKGDEGDEGGDSGKGDEGDSGDASDDGDSGDGDEGGDEGGEPRSYDQAYVDSLRKQNAKYRTERNTAQGELDERKKAEMSDLEKAQTERDEEKTRGDTAETRLAEVLMQSEITVSATKADFHDPQDATSLILLGDIATNDDGSPNRQSVDAAVKRLAESKPHLVKGKGSGSGDGGARGKGGANVKDKQAEYEKQFTQQGGVPMPDLK